MDKHIEITKECSGEMQADFGMVEEIAWIEVDGKPTCPLLCGAYWRAKDEASLPA
jgi:hypothetical protein